MPALVAGIPASWAQRLVNRDRRDKPGDDVPVMTKTKRRTP
jgi:hypothetical protein